jgi:hypothetical protein
VICNFASGLILHALIPGTKFQNPHYKINARHPTSNIKNPTSKKVRILAEKKFTDEPVFGTILDQSTLPERPSLAGANQKS